MGNIPDEHKNETLRGNVVSLRKGGESTERRFFPEPQGHEKILAACKKNRLVMRFDLVGGGELIGQITQFDRWSVTIKDAYDDHKTIYKHGIRYFEKAAPGAK